MASRTPLFVMAFRILLRHFMFLLIEKKLQHQTLIFLMKAMFLKRRNLM
jgi:hypothetical protein